MSPSSAKLEAALQTQWQGSYELHSFETLGSTSRFLIDKLNGQAAESGVPADCCLCVTNRQTAGVGRRGRTWHSPENSITFSMQRHFKLPAANLTGLSLVTGIAVAEVLAGLVPDPVQLKWPNDLLVGGRKLAGILIELPRTDSTGSICITGIGINYADGPEHQNIDQPYATLEALAVNPLPDKRELTGTLAGRVLAEYEQFEQRGWPAFATRWQARDYLNGQPVRLTLGEDKVEGTALGVAADGGLIVKHQGKEKVYYGGEVSVRLAN